MQSLSRKCRKSLMLASLLLPLLLLARVSSADQKPAQNASTTPSLTPSSTPLRVQQTVCILVAADRYNEAAHSFYATRYYADVFPNISWVPKYISSYPGSPANDIQAWIEHRSECDILVSGGPTSTQASALSHFVTVPWVDYSSDFDSDLSRHHHAYLSRVVSPDRAVMEASAAAYRRFDWTTTSVFAANDEVGWRRTYALVAAMKANDVAIDVEVHLDTASSTEQVAGAIDKIEYGESRQLLVLAEGELFDSFVVECVRRECTKRIAVFLIRRNCSDAAMARLSGALCLNDFVNQTAIQGFLDSYSARNITEEQGQLCLLGWPCGTALTVSRTSTASQHDATYHALSALHNYHQQCPPDGLPVPFLRAHQSEGASGQITLDSQGDRNGAVLVLLNSDEASQWHLVAEVQHSQIQFVSSNHDHLEQRPLLFLFGCTHDSAKTLKSCRAHFPVYFWVSLLVCVVPTLIFLYVLSERSIDAFHWPQAKASWKIPAKVRALNSAVLLLGSSSIVTSMSALGANLREKHIVEAAGFGALRTEIKGGAEHDGPHLKGAKATVVVLQAGIMCWRMYDLKRRGFWKGWTPFSWTTLYTLVIAVFHAPWFGFAWNWTLWYFALAVVGVALPLVKITREVHRKSNPIRSVDQIVSTVIVLLGIVTYSYTFACLAWIMVPKIKTPRDGWYFAVVVIATIGFGDYVPDSTVARLTLGVVILLPMLLNFAFMIHSAKSDAHRAEISKVKHLLEIMEASDEACTLALSPKVIDIHCEEVMKMFMPQSVVSLLPQDKLSAVVVVSQRTNAVDVNNNAVRNSGPEQSQPVHPQGTTSSANAPPLFSAHPLTLVDPTLNSGPERNQLGHLQGTTSSANGPPRYSAHAPGPRSRPVLPAQNQRVHPSTPSH